MKNIVVRVIECAFLGLFFCLQACHFGTSDTSKRMKEAEELYRQGTTSNNSSQYEASTYYLKQAEEVLLSIQPSDANPELWRQRNRLLGLTWFRLGNTSESEMLYEIAQAYYRKSIPMLKPETDATFLACAYRDIARTIAIVGGEKDSVLWYFSQADEYAQKAQNHLLLLDIDAYRYQLCFPDSVSRRLTICRQLAEVYNVHTRYSEIVELLLAQHELDSASVYLERLQPVDSAYAYWFEQSYAYLQSKILCMKGRTDEAYDVLLNLYDRKIEELQRDAGARTYALTLHYDVAREQQKAAEAQRERQWQKTISVVLVLLLVSVSLLFIVLWRYWQHRRREQAAQLQTLRDKYKQQLQLALERLQQKVSITREIELQRMRGNDVEFPKWLQTYRNEKLIMNKESLDELIASIDKALDGAISRLRDEYPCLTESDMQFAILTIIGASDNDMSIVLNVQKQTIYHRRQIVRKHILAGSLKGDNNSYSPAEDIDDWLRAYVLR